MSVEADFATVADALAARDGSVVRDRIFRSDGLKTHDRFFAFAHRIYSPSRRICQWDSSPRVSTRHEIGSLCAARRKASRARPSGIPPSS